MLLCFIAKNRQKSGFAIIILSFFMDVTYPLLSSGGSKGPGGGLGPPLFLDQTKARRAEKGFLDDFPTPPPSWGLDPGPLRSSSFFLYSQKMNYMAVTKNLPSNPGPFQRHP